MGHEGISVDVDVAVDVVVVVDVVVDADAVVVVVVWSIGVELILLLVDHSAIMENQ